MVSQTLTVTQLGAFFGCIASFAFGDRLGRRKAVWLGLALNVVGAVLQIAAFHLPQLIVGRIINGFGMGVISSTCPVFMAETSPSAVRGKLVVLGSLCNTVGVCLATWINYALYSNNGAFQWRFPLAFQLVFPLIVACFLPLLVESPRWLLLKDRHQDALKALARLQGKNGDMQNKDLNDDLKSISKTIQEERKSRAPLREVLLFKDESQSMRRLLLR